MSVNRQKGASRFGQRRPPLTELIRNILERYPDGGQILKELIQNADDAGATEVNFLYDNRCHGTESLETPELANFQGPALYCHNNATFKEDDWEGIQNLMRSNKKDDPLKVGQFGIGFNSVYHITDLPGIVSGTTVGFLDPHETHFIDEDGRRGVSGKRYFFDENLPDHISRDQFLPFQGIFDCNIEATESYDGTLFRFPLRTVPSKLSKKNYTKEMVDNLFGSLRDEASVILLFLKSVLNISVHERNQDGEIECVFKVEVAEDTREEVRRKRQEFLNNAKEPTVTESVYIISIQVTLGSDAERFRWLIVNQVGSNEKGISELADKSCLLPWIGMAVALDDENNNASSGRIFCFLPLPSDIDCQTGLPIHVHGYFGLTDNRRGLVWPGTECQNTDTAEWNVFLLKKIAVEVYCKILEVLVQDIPCTGIGQEQRNKLVYARLPVLANVQGHWKVILDPLFRKLMQENQKLFYAQHKPGNSWITLGAGILDRLKESGIASETQEAILKILLDSSQVVITNVPPHVLEILEKYFPPPQVITPALLRSVLKSHDVSTTPYEDKVLLLDFVLRDDPTTDLKGVPLLPLANKQFTKFSPHNHAGSPSTSIFVPTSSCPATLLPNMSHRFLDEDLPEAVGKKLVAMATNDVHSNNSTQLVRVTKEIVLENLRSCLPSEWSNSHEKVQWVPGYSDHPPESWLKEIWRWIHSSFSKTLSPFTNVPLVDLPALPTVATHKSLGVLSQHSKFIFAADDSCNVLPIQVTSLLTAAGCTILFDPPSYLRHPDINSYIAPPTPVGTMSVLSRASLQTVQQHIKRITSDDRGILREFFSRLPESLCTDKRNFLLQLPLFDTLHGSCTAVQVNGQILNSASPQFCLPSGFILRKSEQIISSANPKAHQLLTMLNVHILKPAAVFVRYLFPDIQAKYVYNLQETSTIMLWILRQMFNYKSQCEEFHEAMTALPFVSTDEGELKKPSELYDPNDALLSNLFLEEANKFPSQDYINGQVISALKELGLRWKSMLTAGELLGVALSITTSLCSSSSIRKVQALVEILESNPAYLNQHVDGYNSLKDKLLQLKWLPCAKTPPNSICFPASMPWFDSVKQLFAPTDLRSKSQVLLVGSSMPILGIEMDKSLQEVLGLTSDPPVYQVVTQLKTAVEVWQRQDQKKATSQFQEMLAVIYLHLSQKSKKSVSNAINQASLKQWIWHGTGFCSPRQIALKQDFPLDLRPHLFLLSEELNNIELLADFFLHHRVRQEFSKEDVVSVLTAVREKHSRSLSETITSEEIESDFQLCLSILEWLVKDGETLSESLQERVLLPVHSTGSKLVLKPCKKCLYYTDQTETFLLEDADVHYVHQNIPQQLVLDLGVMSVQEKRLESYSSSFGIPFGQNEKLTDRLANILKGYPCDSGILKELVQNADDAQATEIHFIHDTRVLPHRHLFLKNAQEIQGPALCVYNNRVFTEEDFDGIQKLGVGNKGSDVEKTGQYGIGFNAVYHLTDCPSILSNGDTLCFLDPHCRYLPGATNTHPGRKFQPIDDKFKKDYPDLIAGYLGAQNLKLEDATVFRLPLRNQERSKESSIAQTDATTSIKSLLAAFRRDAKDMLLFLNHVKKICFSVVKESGELVGEYYEASSVLCEQDEKRRIEFASSIKKYKDKLTRKVPCKETTYPMDISDSENNEEKWLIHQCYGVQGGNKKDDIPDGRPLHLFPRGGIAALLSASGPSSVGVERQFVAYCFLPLPCYTLLPVHVNGYFALDTSRRNLQEDKEQNGVLAKWNDFLTSRVLAPGYAALIREARNYIPYCVKDPNEKTKGFFSNEITAHDGMLWYRSLFPDPSILNKSWKILATEVYRVLGSTKAPVLPMVVADEAGRDQDPQELPRRIRSWLPAQKSVFITGEDDTPQDFWKLLLRIGLPLLTYLPPSIYSRFQEAGVTAHLVSPINVINFLQTINDKYPRCEIGKLPIKLEDTKIESIRELRRLIEYCKREEKFGNLLNGLPLLLTADGMLRTFHSNKPVYCSQFSDLCPKWTDKFVHTEFVYMLNCDDDSERAGIQKFGVENIALYMPHIFPADMKGVADHMPWSFPEDDVILEEWFRRLWKFLQKQHNERQVSLDALREWPVIPTTCRSLVTIDSAKTVLDMTETGTEIARERNVRKFLEIVNSPTLNKDITQSSPNGNHENTDFKDASKTTNASTKRQKKIPAVTDRYVAHPHNVADVLSVLDYMRRTGSLIVPKLPRKEILEILMFFQDEYENLEPKTRYNKILKDLPLYKTIDGTHVRLSAFSKYAIVPGCIPMSEITELQSHTGCLFLHSDALPSLNLLYTALGTGAERTVSEFYIEFILPFFSEFSRESQMKFLTHTKEDVLPISNNKEELLSFLKETCCIPDMQGNLRYAKEFYDPRNKVFKIMLDKSSFPPLPFCDDDEWLNFLISIGLQNDVSGSKFLKFCAVVEQTGTNVEQSKVLVRYLLNSVHLHNPSCLSSVSTIKFIASEKVEAGLLAVHDQYQCRENEQPSFVQFQYSVQWKKHRLVWTSAPLLPQWAHPEESVLTDSKPMLCKQLGILENPSGESVAEHLKNISSSVAKRGRERSLSIPVKVKKILSSIYYFLSSCCTGKDSLVQCNEICEKIGRHLETVPCVFIEESNVFVKGKQLSFTEFGESTLKPYFYTVPQVYGSYKHFLKRLGTTDQITPQQLVNILKAMQKDQCQKTKTSSDCKKQAGITMNLLFRLIVDDPTRAIESMSSELYLPSNTGLLMKSNQLVCKVPPHLVETVTKLKYHVLLPFESCGLPRHRETDYLKALPNNLRPRPVESLVREVLDPSFTNNTCVLTRDDSTCDFIKRYLDIMKSNEFQNEIIRLLKHQQKSNELTDWMMERCSRLNTVRVKVKCMETIKIHLLNISTGTVVEGSSLESICHVVNNGNDSWTLYVKHEINIMGILSKCVNEIMDNCLEKKFITVLMDMLSCVSPEKIAGVLDCHDIGRDSCDENIASATKSLNLNIEILKLSKQTESSEASGQSNRGLMRSHHSDVGGSYRGRGMRRGGGGKGKGGKRRKGGAPGGGVTYRSVPFCYFPEVVGYTTPNHEEAHRWMKQSRSDLKAAKYLLDIYSTSYDLVCFLSHQIAEKSLKAALYAKRGLTDAQLYTHNIYQLVSDVGDEMEEREILERLATHVGDYYLNTRYPNRQAEGRVPAEEFDVTEAREAVEAANKLVEIVERSIAE